MCADACSNDANEQKVAFFDVYLVILHVLALIGLVKVVIMMISCCCRPIQAMGLNKPLIDIEPDNLPAVSASASENKIASVVASSKSRSKPIVHSAADLGIVFVTEHGECYHGTRTCPAIVHRTVHAQYRACKFCAKR